MLLTVPLERIPHYETYEGRLSASGDASASFTFKYMILMTISVAGILVDAIIKVGEPWLGRDGSTLHNPPAGIYLAKRVPTALGFKCTYYYNTEALITTRQDAVWQTPSRTWKRMRMSIAQGQIDLS
jgi:hypothetical protein